MPFHRQFIIGDLNLDQSKGRDKDIGFYGQDSWKSRSAHDDARACVWIWFDASTRSEPATAVEHRGGAAARILVLLTSDAKNVLRGTYGKYHQQLMGTRNPVPSFGGNDAQGLRNTYDLDANGSFETVIVTPPVATSISNLQFDPGPSSAELRRVVARLPAAVPGQMAIDVAGIVKVNHDQYAQVDINGIYPDGPNQPFGGFGKVDPNQGLLYRLTNNAWSTTHYRALQATLTKNLSRADFQMLFTVQRQWQHLEGTWNPSDPAQFIQPDAFANNKNIWRTDGVAGPQQPGDGKFAGQQPDVESVLGPHGRNVARAVEPGGVGKLHDRGWKLDRTGHRSAAGQQPTDPRLRTNNCGVLDRGEAVEPARHAHPVRLSDARRRPATGARRAHRRREGGASVFRSAAIATWRCRSTSSISSTRETSRSSAARGRIGSTTRRRSGLYTNPQTPRAATFEVVTRF